LHVVAPSQLALFAHTLTQTAPTAPPKFVQDAWQAP